MSGLLILYALAFAHLIADYLLQFDWIAKRKNKSYRVLTIHTLIHGIITLIFVATVTPLWFAFLSAIIIIPTHWVIDATNLDIREDQISHIASFFIIAFIGMLLI